MAHDETIRIYRSDVPGAEPPSLTYGELAANLADRKVFVGGPGGTADMIVLLETPDTGVTGISAGHTGIAVSGITGFVQVFNMGVLSIDGQTGHYTTPPIGATGDTVVSGIAIGIVRGDDNTVTINNLGVTSFNGQTGAVTYSVPLATNGLSGVASFQLGQFSVSNTGHVSLANDSINLDPRSGIAVSPNKVSLGGTLTVYNTGVTSFNGATGSISLFDFVEGGEGILLGSKGAGTVLTITNIGVTGISAGHTGIALSGTTGNVQIFNMGVLSIDGKTGHYSTPPIGATGDTVTAGLAIGVSVVSGNNKRIDNLGVTSFNGLTGAVTLTGDGGAVIGGGNNTITARIATSGATGVASFPPTFFAVNDGAVSLSGPYGVIGVTGIAISDTDGGLTGRVVITGGTNVSITKEGNRITISSNDGATGDTVLAGIGTSVIRTDGTNVVTVNNMGVTSFNGLTGTVLYAPPLATIGASGVASFLATDFSVSNTGHVSLSSRSVTVNTNTGSGLVGGGSVNLGGSLTLANVGVTGISAGHTGIALSGTTGNVQIWNMGVLSLDGQTGHLNRGATGDTITAGVAVGVSVVSGNQKRIDNLGVTSFNGLTGAVSYSPPLATNTGTTGVAAYNNQHFSVSSGTVSISDITMNVFGVDGSGVLNTVGTGIGTLTVTGSSGIRTSASGGGSALITIYNTGVTGISAGHTGISLVGTTGNAVIFNMGVLSVNGYTGHVNLDEILIEGATGDTVIAGVAIGLARDNNAVTINNLGVTGILQDDRTLTGAIRFNSGKGITFSYGTGGLTFANTGVLTINSVTPDSDGNFIIPAATVVTGDGGALVGDGVRILARLATSSLTGVASFPTEDFGVVDGAVSLTGNVARTNLQNVFSATQILSAGLSASGGITSNGTIVTTNSAGFSGPTLNTAKVTHPSTGLVVEPFGGGVGTIKFTDKFSGNSLSISPTSLIVDRTISFPDASGTVALTNAVVTSLNGNVGALTITGDGAAIRGVGNNIIGTRLADTDVTGVAFFDSAHFTVNTGRVSLKTAYTITGDTVLSGVAIGVARNSNEVRINNLGVTSFNGLTGAVRYAPPLATTGASGVASFLSTHFAVSSTGHVSLQPIKLGEGDIADFDTGSVDDGLVITYNPVHDPSQPYYMESIGNLYSPRVVSGSLTGVASFNSTHFSVSSSTGHVSLASAYTVTGNTVVAGSGIAIPASLDNSRTIINVGVTGISAGHTGISLIGTTGNVRIFNMGVLSIDGKTGHYTTPPIGATGDTITAGLAIGVSVVSGNQKRIDNLGVTSFNGLTGAVLYAPPLATIGASGVASFLATDFSVSNTGHVSLSSRSVTINTGSGLVGGGSVSLGGTLALTNIGVTGISAGHTGIALSGITGNVQIWNMGVLSIDGKTGHYTTPPLGVTGDTITPGLAIGVSVVSGNNKRIDNLGVTSFNGLTGAVTMTGDGGAVIGIGNNTIRARFATESLTGVASFPATFFAVNNGAVSLSGPYSVIGVTGISAGHTGIALIGTTGNVRIFNMGVHTFNGATGHITFNPVTGNTVLAGSGIAIPSSLDNTRTIINVGVTGIGFGANDAGLTGKINLTAGTSITLDYNPANKTITINSTGVVGATGDTVVAGVGISAIRNNNEVRINNMGVTSFNGLTGAVTLTGDSGAIIGRGNNTITARLATASLTGVASFPTADFGVVNGAVSLTGNVARTGIPNIFTSTNTFNATTQFTNSILGLSAANASFSVIRGANNPIIVRPHSGTLPSQGGLQFESQDVEESFYSTLSPVLLSANRTIYLPDASGTIALTNNTVTSLNGLAGARTLTGDGGAIVGVGNTAITARVTTSAGATGVASFNSSHFSVSSSTGHVSLAAAYQATGDTVITVAGSGIAISTNGKTDTLFNIGVTSFNGLTGTVTLTGDSGAIIGRGNNTITARVTTSAGATGVASFNTTHFSVSSSTGHVSLASAYTVTGDTVRGDNGAITVGNPSGRLKDVTVRVALVSADPIEAGTTGVAAFFQDHFTVTDGLVKLAADGGGGDCGGLCPQLNSGLGASAAPDGSLAYLYLDVGNLTTASGDVVSTDNLIFFDASETGLIKTKKANVRKILVDTSADVFATKTTGQLSFQKDSSSINYNVVLGAVAAGQEGLVKGASAFAYITQNTVKSINGQTGDIGCIAVTCAAQTFTGLQTFATGISAANLWVSGGATFGTVTATTFNGALNGNASTATTASNANSLGGTAANLWALQSWVTSGLNGKANTSGNNATGTWPINITGNAGSATTATTATNANSLGGTAANSWALQSWVTSGLNGKANTSGNNASGTWPINITGNAGSATTATNSTQLGGTAANSWALQSWVTSGLNGKANTSGNNATGTWPINITGNAGTATTATTATNANSLGGTAANSWALQSWVTSGLDGKANTSGNNATGTWPINITGNAATATTASTATNANSLGGTAANSWALLSSIGNGTLTLNTSGIGLGGSQTFSANQSGAGTFTVTSNATGNNVSNTIVARDASGNFSAGTITAILSGTASSATTATNSNSLGGTAANSWALQSWVTSGLNGKANTTGNNATGTWPINITGNAGSATTATTATNSNSLGGTAADSWALQSWVTSGLNGKANTSGNNASGTWPINITGNAGSATTASTATNANSLGGTAANSWALQSYVGNGTLTLNTSGIGLGGSQTFTANQSGAATFTVSSNATGNSVANTIVARDASGNFSAGTITAILSGTASSATTATNSTQLGGTAANSWALQSWVTTGLNGKANTSGNNATGTWPINITGNAGSATTATTANQVSNALTIGSGLVGTSSTYNGSAAVTIANIGVTSLNGLTGARTLTGDGGAIFGTANTTIAARLASTSATGAASFSSTNFDVSGAGAVSIKTGGVSNSNLANSTISGVSLGNNLNALTIGSGLGGVSYNGQTATTITNTGVLNVNGSNGAVTISLTGDGGAIEAYNPVGAATIPLGIRTRLASTSLTGVASFDSTIFNVSTTGHVTLSGTLFSVRDEIGGSDNIARGDTLTITGGQGIDFLRTGKNNYAIRGATATTGIPGVASFLSTDFSVSSTGHVSLSNVAKTNAANTFTGLQTFSNGITATGATFGGRVSINGDIDATSSNITLNGSLIDILAPDGVIKIGDPDQANNGTFIEVHDQDQLITASRMVDLQYGVQSGYPRIEWAGLTSSYDLLPSHWVSISAPINSSPTQNDAYFAPIFITRRVTIKTIGTQAGTNASANTGNIRLGLYNSDDYGYPKDRLYTSGDIALSTGNFAVQRATGVDTIVNPGQYWLAIVYSASGLATAGLGRFGSRMKFFTQTSSSPIGGGSTDGLRKAQGSFTLATSQSGTFTSVEGTNNPAIFYTAEVVL